MVDRITEILAIAQVRLDAQRAKEAAAAVALEKRFADLETKTQELDTKIQVVATKVK